MSSMGFGSLNVQQPPLNVQQFPTVMQPFPLGNFSTMPPVGTWPTSQPGQPLYTASIPGASLTPIPPPLTGAAATGVSPWELAAVQGIGNRPSVGTSAQTAYPKTWPFSQPTFAQGGGVAVGGKKGTKAAGPQYLQGIGPSSLINLGADPKTDPMAGALTKKGKGKTTAVTDPFSVAAIKKLYASVPDFNFTPVSYTPTTWTNIKTPQISYHLVDPKALSYLNADPNSIYKQFLGPLTQGVNAQLTAGVKKYLKTIGATAQDLQNFAKYVKNLPSLNQAATNAALAILNPQVASARQAAMNNANFINTLGNAAAGLQNQISGNVAAQYRNSAAAMGALAQGVGQSAMAPLSQEIANTALTGSQTPSTMAPGGNVVANIPAGAAGALSQLQGVIPGQSLLNQAPLATQLGASMAQQLQGGAQQASKMALAAGNQNVAQLMAQLPELQNQQLTQLENQRNASLDRQLQLLVQSGQITQQGAQAILNASQQAGQNTLGALTQSFTTAMQNAGTNASTLNQATIGNAQIQNTADAAQAQLAGQIATTNAEGAAQTARANAQGALSANQTNAQLAMSQAANVAAAQSRALSNYIALWNARLKSAGATGLKPMTANEEAKFNSNVATSLQAWSHGSQFGGTTTVTPTPGHSVVVRLPKSQPLTPDKAWRNFETTFGPSYVRQYGKYAPQVMLGVFKSYFTNIPADWGIAEIRKNYGQLTGDAFGQGAGFGGVNAFPPQPPVTVYPQQTEKSGHG